MEVIVEPKLLSRTKEKFSGIDYLKILNALKSIQNKPSGLLLKSHKVRRIRDYFIDLGNEYLYSYKITPRIRILFSISKKENYIYILDVVAHDQLGRLNRAKLNNLN